MHFDRLLQRQLHRIAVGLTLAPLSSCITPPGKEPPSEACTADTPPDGLVLQVGYVPVPVGADCPDEPSHLDHLECCPVYAFKDEVCGFVDKLENQVIVSGAYGAWFEPADSPTDTAMSVSGPYDICRYEGVFEDTGACCGRPLLADGEAVLPPVIEGSDWSSEARWHLDPAERARIGSYWLTAARLEHASIASFARFTLDLMRFGAPPELLADAQRAAMDEVDHARRCFDLASRALGRSVGPGPLDLSGVEDLDRIGFAEALVREGCVGETLAALDAAARLTRAVEPAVRETLEAIQRDEANHAALAWRTLAWLLSDDDGTLRAHLQAVFDDEADTLAAEPFDPTSTERAHGLIGSDERLRIFRDGFERVIRPAWNAIP